MVTMMDALDLKNFVYKNRLASFGDKWPYDKEEGATCTSDKVRGDGGLIVRSIDNRAPILDGIGWLRVHRHRAGPGGCELLRLPTRDAVGP